MMEILIILFSFVLWGMLLSVGYQIMLNCLAKIAFAPFRVFVYGLGILLCFGGTSVFLYLLNGGDWGLYGFLATALGFIIYYRRFWFIGEKFFKNSHRVMGKTGKILKKTGKFGTDIFVSPFAYIVGKGEGWLAHWEQKRRSEKERNSEQTAEIPLEEESIETEQL